MAYTINKTDGTVVAIVPDGQTDTFSTDLTFIGKNYSGFGESLNENFVRLLENFSGTRRPTTPIRGQLWYDTGSLKLNIYNGTEFTPVSSATIADTRPLNLGTGDLWYNNLDRQLYFYNGIDTVLLGPDYSISQGTSGLRVESILDTLNQTRVITYLYTGGALLGIFSKDAFTPKQLIPGFSGSIGIGFNAGILSNFKFNTTVLNAENLGSLPATTYIRNDQSSIINGQLALSSNLGLTIGIANQGEFQIQQGNSLVISNVALNGKFLINVRRSESLETAIEVDPTVRKVSVYKDYPDSELSVRGNLVVDGNLTVNGDTTSINVGSLVIEDKTLNLGYIENSIPSDGLVDGAGIVVSGDTDHTLLWSNSRKAWESSEHLNLSTGNAYKINGVTVLDSTACYVSNFPLIENFGKQTLLKVGPGVVTDPPAMTLGNTRISTTTDAVLSDLELAPYPGGNVSLIDSPKITGLANPTNLQDAATKNYVDASLALKTLVFSMDISDGISNIAIAGLLDNLAPTAEYRNGTRARILCSTTIYSTASLDINPLLTLTKDTFNTPAGAADAVIDVSISTATVPAPVIDEVQRVIKTFEISGGSWGFVS